MDEIMQKLKEEMLGKDNVKVKSESLEEFLTNHKTKELVKMCLIALLGQVEANELLKIRSYANKPKREIIEFINNNLEKILYGYLEMLSDYEFEQLKMLMNRNGKKVYFTKKDISIGFLTFIKGHFLGNVEYNKEEDYVRVFIPEEFIKIFRKGLRDYDLLERNKHIQEVSHFIDLMVCAYGVIPIKKMHEIFEKLMYKIDINELIEIMFINSAHTESIFSCSYRKNQLVFGVDFEDDKDAIEFYKKQEGEYKVFSLKDYEALYDGSYMYTLKSYNSLANYLIEKYNLSNADLDYIDDYIIHDFMICSQLDPLLAETHFKSKFKKMFDSDYKTINEMLILLKNIYKEYPKWSKRGNI